MVKRDKINLALCGYFSPFFGGGLFLQAFVYSCSYCAGRICVGR